jgi:hypothetical protein
VARSEPLETTKDFGNAKKVRDNGEPKLQKARGWEEAANPHWKSSREPLNQLEWV